jgi:6-phosphogluconolactonase (cycloisomerase 2 family)
VPRFFRFIALAILLSVIAFLIGCGASASSGTSLSSSPGSGSNPAPDYGVGIGASGQTGPAKFMYANPAGLGGPYALAIQSGGLLTQQTSGSADNNDPMTMAIDPSGSLLFQTANGYDGGTLGGLFAYVIDRSSGSLTTASGSPYLVGQSLFADIVDNSGKFLYVQGESGVYGFSIQSGGTLTPVSGSPFSAAGPPSSPGFPTPAHLMAVDQSNRYLYVSTSAGISAYTMDPSTGQLAAISGSPFGSSVSGPWTITVTPNNSFLYELQATNTGVMYGYGIDSSTGGLTALPGSPFSVGTCGSSAVGIPGPDNITIPSAGNFMYTNCGIYSLDNATGAVAQVSNFVAGDWPVIDPTGDFLWAITAQQNCFHCEVGVTAYQVDPNTGSLTAVPNSLINLNNSEVGWINSLAITE